MKFARLSALTFLYGPNPTLHLQNIFLAEVREIAHLCNRDGLMHYAPLRADVTPHPRGVCM